MSTMQDCEMEQLSRLFAQGNLRDARKISRLLKAELGEPADDRTGIERGGLRAAFARLFRE
jgi:hypothetical protein